MGKGKYVVSKKDNSKLVDIFIIIGIIFLIASLVLMFVKNNKSLNHISELSYTEYKEKIMKDDYTIILLTSPTCTHCINYKPYVNLVAEENNLQVYNINLNNLKYEEYVEIHDKYSAISSDYGDNNEPIIRTPATVIVKNGEEVESILGDIGYNGFQSLLKRNNIIK